MQALFAYNINERANLQLAKEYISDAFMPNLNSMEFQDKEKLKSNTVLGHQLLLSAYAEVASEVPVEANTEVLKVVAEAKANFKNKNKTDKLAFKRRIVAEAEMVYDCYLQVLALFVELGERSSSDKNFEGLCRFADNSIVKALAESSQLTNLLLRRNANWDDEALIVTKLYREVIKVNDRYLNYVTKSHHTPEEDLALLKYVLKNVILKHELTFDYFERKDIYWTDDIETIRSMVMRTIQPLVEVGELSVETLDETWDDNRAFLETLFVQTIDENDELTELLIPKLKNWDVERVADMDKILIKMGLVEMMNHPSIPTKVTINEIIEIAKNYSTEKSGTFVNGVLDTLSKELSTAGKIRKSGRGMIDNK